MNTRTEKEIRELLSDVHPVLFAYALEQAEALLGDEISDQERDAFEAIVAEYAPEIGVAETGDEVEIGGVTFIAWEDHLNFYYVNENRENFSVTLMTPFGGSITLAHLREAQRTQVEMDEGNAAQMAEWDALNAVSEDED